MGGCSEPMVCGARRERFRSTCRRSGGSARRWCGRCATATQPGARSWPAATRASPAAGSSASSPSACSSQGGTLTSAGIIPTPAVAYLTPRMGYTAGVVISASHNPVRGQRHQGVLRRRREVHRGARAAGRSDRRRRVVDGRPIGDGRAAVEQSRLPRRRTSTTSREILPPTLRTAGMRIAIDCANGATTTVAPRVFEELGLRDDVASAASRTAATSTCTAARRHPELLAQHRRRRRLPTGHRLRRRRRPRDLRRRAREGRRRRRRDADVRQADEGRGPPEGRRDRRHGDEQHRPRDRAARGRHRHGRAARSATST